MEPESPALRDRRRVRTAIKIACLLSISVAMAVLLAAGAGLRPVLASQAGNKLQQILNTTVKIRCFMMVNDFFELVCSQKEGKAITIKNENSWVGSRCFKVLLIHPVRR